MLSITGNYTPPSDGIKRWAVDWMYGFRGTSPRKWLAEQLSYIRKFHGTVAAKEYRNYILWLGSYPCKRRVG